MHETKAIGKSIQTNLVHVFSNSSVQNQAANIIQQSLCSHRTVAYALVQKSFSKAPFFVGYPSFWGLESLVAKEVVSNLTAAETAAGWWGQSSLKLALDELSTLLLPWLQDRF